MTTAPARRRAFHRSRNGQIDLRHAPVHHPGRAGDLSDLQHGTDPAQAGNRRADAAASARSNTGRRRWIRPMSAMSRARTDMGHDLVPVYEDGGTGGVAVDPVIRQSMGVRTAVVERARPAAAPCAPSAWSTFDETAPVRGQQQDRGVDRAPPRQPVRAAGAQGAAASRHLQPRPGGGPAGVSAGP